MTSPISVVLQVFAKAPLPGFAKTRLIPRLGAEGAARLQAALVWHSLARCREVAKSCGGSVELWCAPACSEPFFGRCRAEFGAALRRQRGPDLGTRMSRAMRAGLAQASAVVLLGSDAPSLGAAQLSQAVTTLISGRDAVLVPASDGGYVLIGLTRFHPMLFERIAWGSDQVYAETCARLGQCGYHWRSLEVLDDLDTPQDWDRLLAVAPEWRSRVDEP